ncbi:triple tyrosine motif-containing protein [Mangrovivirga sp. M17]|uniref:Triple tyrosine motif-containing protein n=1 Tax=Mangrovivirga halotolerans TaxID=2993936 RepID=A0ABT3RMW8_9BACT|nr:sensor histidine kinase [Mangrovivirga halotolerans]MCX2743104.1 triple tyrosine motif-containing protein [Mangrovivirga halotolerans]
MEIQSNGVLQLSSLFTGLLNVFLIFFLNTVDSNAQNFELNHIDYSYGLSNSQISTIKPDQHGFIWIGTHGGGVYRWDGQNLTPLSDSLKYTFISDILPVKDQGMWVASLNSLSLVTKESEYKQMDSLVNLLDDAVVHLYETEKSVITFSKKGSIHSIIKSDLRPYDNIILDSLDGVYRVFQANNTFHVFAGYYYYQIQHNNGRLTIKEEMSISEKFGIQRPVHCYSVHREKSKWLVKIKNKVIFYDKNFFSPVERNFPIENHAYSINYFKGYWWCSFLNGLYQLKLGETDFKVIKKHLSFPGWSSLVTDKNLWIGGFNGLYEISLPKIQPIANPPFGTPGYFAFARNEDEIWAGGVSTGIIIYDEMGYIKDSIRFDENMYNEIRCFLDMGDELLVSSWAGLLKVNKKTKKSIPVEYLNEKRILSMALSKDKSKIYFGSNGNGLFIKEEDSVFNYTESDGLPSNRIWSLLPLEDQLVIGTEKGVAVYSRNGITKLELNKKFLDMPVTSIEKIDDDNIAIGFAQYGLVIYNLKSRERENYLTDKNGLSSSYIYFLKMIDEELWVGSSLGIDIINFRDTTYSVFQLRDVEKIGGAETFLNGIIELEEEVWVSTIAGTISVPKHIKMKLNQSKPNPVVIEYLSSLTIDESIYHKSIFGLSGKNKDLAFPYNHNSIKIIYNTAEFDKLDTRFVYQLDGYDPVPTEPTSYRTVVYKHLPPGEYTFKVWRYPLQSDEEIIPTEIDFKITTPFYMTDLFRIIALLAPVIIIIYFMWLKSKSNMHKALEENRIWQEAQDELRKDMAIDFHDEMGNHLAKIINFSGVLRMKGLSSDQIPVVNKIERSAQELFVSTKDLLWSLKKGNNNLEEIFFHIKDFSDRLYDRTNTNVRLNKNTDASHILLNPKASRDLSLIIKEALTNIYKHAEAENISFEVYINGREYADITIQDDGEGFNYHGLNGHNGLRNMQQRAARSGFNFNISSRKGQGTKIDIRINKESNV